MTYSQLFVLSVFLSFAFGLSVLGILFGHRE